MNNETAIPAASGAATYITHFHSNDHPQWVTRVEHGPYVAYHYTREAADQLTGILNERIAVLQNCEQHRAYAHMMQEQRSQIADYCRTLEKQIQTLQPGGITGPDLAK